VHYENHVIHVEKGSNPVEIVDGYDVCELQFWEFGTKLMDEFSRAYAKEGWTESAPLR